MASKRPVAVSSSIELLKLLPHPMSGPDFHTDNLGRNAMWCLEQSNLLDLNVDSEAESAILYCNKGKELYAQYLEAQKEQQAPVASSYNGTPSTADTSALGVRRSDEKATTPDTTTAPHTLSWSEEVQMAEDLAHKVIITAPDPAETKGNIITHPTDGNEIAVKMPPPPPVAHVTNRTANQHQTGAPGPDMWFREGSKPGTYFWTPIAKKELVGISRFGFDFKQVWPTFRAKDNKGNPIFDGVQKPFLQRDPESGRCNFTLSHLHFTYHPRIEKDPRQLKQYLEDHGIFIVCDSCIRNHRPCDHGLPCDPCKQRGAECTYKFAVNSMDKHCRFSPACRNVHGNALAFFDWRARFTANAVKSSQSILDACSGRVNCSYKPTAPTASGQRASQLTSTPKVHSTDKTSAATTTSVPPAREPTTDEWQLVARPIKGPKNASHQPRRGGRPYAPRNNNSTAEPAIRPLPEPRKRPSVESSSTRSSV